LVLIVEADAEAVSAQPGFQLDAVQFLEQVLGFC
jgi:hypothetical protein